MTIVTINNADIYDEFLLRKPWINCASPDGKLLRAYHSHYTEFITLIHRDAGQQQPKNIDSLDHTTNFGHAVKNHP